MTYGAIALCPFAEGPAGALLQDCGGGVELDLGVAVGLVDRLGGLAKVMEVAELVGHAVEGLGHRLADRRLAVGDDPGDRHPQRPLHLAEQLRQVVLRRRQQAPGQQDLAGEARRG